MIAGACEAEGCRDGGNDEMKLAQAVTGLLSNVPFSDRRFGIAAKSRWIAGSGLLLKDVEGDVDESGEQLWQVLQSLELSWQPHG